MCGIAGSISQDPANVSSERMHAAIQCLRHRGPQGHGYWQNNTGEVALAHSRLSIIDLSDAAAQPLHYAGRYTIVHNGEIYNYIELKKLLEQKGYVFQTASDTEVIIAAYDAWKESCLQYFDGMFAFAIWDEKEKILFAARDRMGEKPFYYAYGEGTLHFASEFKALFSLGVPRMVSSAMLYNFLTIGYTSDPSDPAATFYNDVLQLPPASFLCYAVKENKLTVEKYWQVFVEPDHSISEAAALEQFRSLLTESIRKRLRSDVPIGTSLSGGLDSASIVAFCNGTASEQYSHKCFTATFKGFEKDESAHAALVAKSFGLEHHLVTIQPDEVVPLMEKVMKGQEVPFSSGSVLAQYKVYEAAKQEGVTVLLDGQGADELLAGYHKYYRWFWQELYRNKKLKTSGELNAARAIGINERFSLKEKTAALLPDLASGFLQSRKSKEAFNHPALNRDFAFSNKQQLYYALPATQDLNGALYFNSFVHGLDELLRLADRNSMMHGVEVRLPFLSHELIAFLFTLPASYKIRHGWTKWLLRKTVDPLLPAEITWRKDKTAFEPPQEQWMQLDVVKDSIRQGKEKLVSEGILNPGVLKNHRAHSAYAAGGMEWKLWSTSLLFND